MKQFNLTMVSVICALAVTACSGGGGGGSNNSAAETAKNNVTASNNTTTTNTTSNTAQSSQNNTITNPSSSGTTASGGSTATGQASFTTPPQTAKPDALAGSILTLDKTSAVLAPSVNYSNEDLDELVIGSTKVALLTATDKLNGTAVDSLKKITQADVRSGSASNVSGYVGSQGQYGTQDRINYQAMRYGVYTADGVSHLFVQGYLTPATTKTTVRGVEFLPMPDKGVFKYTGNAVYGKDNNYSPSAAEVIADFGNKKVKVEVKQPGLVFGGEISGNTFKGTRNGIQTQGAFYSTVAQDVGGVFLTGDGTNGAFGASNKRASGENLSNF